MSYVNAGRPVAVLAVGAAVSIRSGQPLSSARPKSAEDGFLVVVVDDDEAVLASLRFSLGIEGFAVATFRSEEQLRRLIAWPQRGVLLIEQNLAGRDGLALLARLRREGVTLPAVLTTSQMSDALRRRAAAAAVEIVEKPVLDDALVNAVRRTLAAGSLARY